MDLRENDFNNMNWNKLAQDVKLNAEPSDSIRKFSDEDKIL
jgi:hypothetical protein